MKASHQCFWSWQQNPIPLLTLLWSDRLSHEKFWQTEHAWSHSEHTFLGMLPRIAHFMAGKGLWFKHFQCALSWNHYFGHCVGWLVYIYSVELHFMLSFQEHGTGIWDRNRFQDSMTCSDLRFWNLISEKHNRTHQSYTWECLKGLIILRLIHQCWGWSQFRKVWTEWFST